MTQGLSPDGGMFEKRIVVFLHSLLHPYSFLLYFLHRVGIIFLSFFGNDSGEEAVMCGMVIFFVLFFFVCDDWYLSDELDR